MIVKPSAPPAKLVTDGSIAGTSFQRASGQIKHRLIVSVEGKEKSGKTHFALTAPGPIGFQDIDIGTEGVIEPFAAEKEIHLAEYSVSFPYVQRAAEETWKQFTNDYKALLGSHVRTAIIDNASEAWDLLRIAKFGKLSQIMPHLYTTANTEWRELMRMAYKADTNLLLLHKVKKQYLNEQWNGKYERSGFNDIGYLVQVVVETYMDNDKFMLRVLECRQNAKAKGAVIEDPTFSKLGVVVFPDTKEEDWM